MKRNRDKRRSNAKNSIVKMYVFTEGMVTEEKYLSSLVFDLFGRNSKLIQIEKGTSNTSPKQILEIAKETKAEAPDALVFIVIDEDDKLLTDFPEVLQYCNTLGVCDIEGINCILSCRSFEFWGLLHFRDTSACMNKKQLLKALEKEMPTFNENNKVFDYDLMKDKLNIALKRALKIRENHKQTDNNPYKINPTTNVDELVLKIREVSESIK